MQPTGPIRSHPPIDMPFCTSLARNPVVFRHVRMVLRGRASSKHKGATLAYAGKMSADAILYCLERISDYRDFERLCSALLAGAGYPAIEPLGGTGDKGRDAIIRVDDLGLRTIFAYTVRSDWRAKLDHDCSRVKEMGHNPDMFVFVCTEALSATEKDVAHQFVSEKFGWKLDLYDLERLRVQLAGPQRHLIAQHPSIFTPPFFPQRGGQSLSASRDTILIDHVVGDHAVATWLARRLSLQGYHTWCYGTAPLAGESLDDTVRKLLEARTNQYLPVVSTSSLSDRAFLERCAIAAAKDDFVLPCSCILGTDDRLPSRLSKVVPADFTSSWDLGLRQVLARLGSLGLKPWLEPERGRQIALRDYLPTRVTVAKPERVFSNVFPLQVPSSMLIYDLQRSLTESEIQALRPRWAFVEVGANRLVSFSIPPSEAIPMAPVKHTPEFAWSAISFQNGKRTTDIAKELARRSLEVACAQAGLQYCENRRVFYFQARDSGEWVQPIQHVDGRSTTVSLTGQRTKGYGERASLFLYQLAPRLIPRRDQSGMWSVDVSIYVRTTTLDGKVFEGKEIGRRRKIVGKSWWNQQWLARLLGVVQALQTSPGRIEIGDGRRAVVMGTAPFEWECPVSLDVQALSSMSDIGEEIANMRSTEDEEDEADDDAAESPVGAPR